MLILVYDLTEENLGLRNKYLLQCPNKGKLAEKKFKLNTVEIIETWAKDTSL